MAYYIWVHNEIYHMIYDRLAGKVGGAGREVGAWGLGGLGLADGSHLWGWRAFRVGLKFWNIHGGFLVVNRGVFCITVVVRRSYCNPRKISYSERGRERYQFLY